jgi:hypothetical protein
VETGLIIIGLLYLAMSIWAVIGLFTRSSRYTRG